MRQAKKQSLLIHARHFRLRRAAARRNHAASAARGAKKMAREKA